MRGEFITLGQLLKLVGVAGSGGGAKQYLAEEIPTVNGEPDSRRGRKLHPGDTIHLPGAGTIRLTALPPDSGSQA